MSSTAPSGRDGSPPTRGSGWPEASSRPLGAGDASALTPDVDISSLTPPPLVIDCDSCLARGPACGDCVVTCLLGPPPPEGRQLDEHQVQAIGALSASGLVPPLRLVTAVDGPVEPEA
jgi:hypothetical protein